MNRRRVLSFLKGRRERGPSPSATFLKNGSLLLEKLIAASNGKYDIPICSLTSEELARATNNFVDHFHKGRFSNMCRGSWKERPILVKKFLDSTSVPSDAQYDTLSGVINDIATTVQMSHHKNVLKFLGCCLEFEHPALVYECTGNEFLLSFLLNGISNRPLTWRSRLKIANDIANAILYLHSAFRTPIIYRILNPRNIIIDQCGVAKLFDFSFSISLPPGKLEVQDDVIGITGYIDFEYYSSGFVSQKTDVYSFGVLLLVLVTGEEAIRRDEEGDQLHIVHYVTDCMKRNEFNRIVDPRMNDAGETILQGKQLHAFLGLALKCTQDRRKDRPNMIDVGKELLEISRR